jgi:transposase
MQKKITTKKLKTHPFKKILNTSYFKKSLGFREFPKEITEDVILIMDGAGWHKSKDLKVPKNIEIVLLPPYYPELNPVERLWRHIKDHTIRNKVFDTLLELENEISEFVKNLTDETILKV